MAVIEVDDLHKSYGGVHAVRGVSLSIDEGEVYALLGPNGAGKSTTIEILEGHRDRTSGSVSVLGMDPATGGREFRDRMGIVLQSSGIEDELSVSEALRMYSASYRSPRDPEEVLELVGLADKADARVKQLSGGQQRRIDLALGIIGNPEVLFLDEPTTGFDPAARRKSWELVDRLRSLGTTIMLTTHYMDEAQHLADRVGVIVGGEIVAEGAPAELIDASADTTISFHVASDVSLAGLPLIDARVEGHVVSARTATPTQALHDLTGWALAGAVELVDLSVTRPSLEDVYLQLAQPDDAP